MLTVLEHQYIAEMREDKGPEVALSSADIDELYQMGSKPGFGRLIHTERQGLRFGGYCGVISTESGTEIEVLPKITTGKESDDEKQQSRKYLLQMLDTVYNVTALSVGDANVNVVNKRRLLDVYISKFLQIVLDITHKGIKRSYIRQKGALPIVKGRLRMNEQARRMPHQQHINYVEFSEYVYDRPENRLIAYCLKLVASWTQCAENRQLARQLSIAFECVEKSSAINADFKGWSTKRDMRYYEPARQWVEMIIRYRTPYAIKGAHTGPSLMLQTDQLFEKYVGIKLRQQLNDGHDLVLQGKEVYLIHKAAEETGRYRMKPDYMIYERGNTNRPLFILDAKWKLVNHEYFLGNDNASDVKNDATPKDMSENDLRQMFVYAHKYMGGKGDLILIYPKHEKFMSSSNCFYMDHPQNKLRLWVLPFDFKTEQLLLPEEFKNVLLQDDINFPFR